MDSPWTSRATLVFLSIAFGIPWSGWTLLAILHPLRHTALWWCLFLTGCFCSVAGFIASYVESGWAGPKSLILRTARFRLPISWWLYAFFLFSLGGVISTAIYGYTHGGIGTIKPLLLFTLFAPSSLFWFVTGPLGEEFGWRGFLLPRLLQRYSPLTSSIILGLIWELWHFPLYYHTFLHDFRGTANFTIGVLGLSLLVTVLFIHTDQSLAPVIVLHWTGNVSMSAVHKMFPGVRPADAQDPYDMITMAIITLLVVILFMPGSRRRSPELAEVSPS
jgi:CAAX protease family protein